MMRIRKNIRELLGDLIPNSPNKSHNNGIADVRRITNRIFGVKGLRQALNTDTHEIQTYENKLTYTKLFKQIC